MTPSFVCCDKLHGSDSTSSSALIVPSMGTRKEIERVNTIVSPESVWRRIRCLPSEDRCDLSFNPIASLLNTSDCSRVCLLCYYRRVSLKDYLRFALLIDGGREEVKQKREEVLECLFATIYNQISFPNNAN